MKTTIRTLPAVLACAAATAVAQTPAVPPPSGCDKPDQLLWAGAASSDQTARIQKRVDAYKNCINAYAKSNNAKAQELANEARAYQEAGNQAIEEYNQFAKDLNDKANATK